MKAKTTILFVFAFCVCGAFDAIADSSSHWQRARFILIAWPAQATRKMYDRENTFDRIESGKKLTSGC